MWPDVFFGQDIMICRISENAEYDLRWMTTGDKHWNPKRKRYVGFVYRICDLNSLMFPSFLEMVPFGGTYNKCLIV